MSEHRMLCMGCMEPLDELGICPYCGYSDSALNPSMYMQPKTVLDSRYIVGRLISCNGESAVYMGYDITESTKVLIKEYMPDAICQRADDGLSVLPLQNSIVQYKNYMSEFIELNKALMRLRTMSHIVAPSDMFSANNTAYAVLPYFECITLKQYLQNQAGELTWEQVKKLFPPLFTTLGCIHNAGILHRGISLENILVTDRGELKLTGFSIPAVRTVNTDLAPELYTGYSAPEQYAASEWEGTWTDVYAVAAVMYRLLTGCMPTEAMARIGQDSLLEPVKINPHVPANVSKVIMQAMRLSCEQRIKTVTDMVTKLFDQPEYMTKLPMGATQTIPISTGSQAKRRSSSSKNRRHSNVFMIMGTVLLIGIVVAAFFALVMMLLPSDNTTDPIVPNNPAVTLPQDNVTTPDTPQATTEVTVPPSPPVTTEPKKEGTMFVMPGLVGKKYSSVAESDTWKGRLEFEAIYEYSDEYESGYIFDQDTPEGTDLYPVQHVKLFVSQGLAVVTIPDFITEFGMRMTKEEYIAVLDELNIKYEFRELETPNELTGYVMGVYCPETSAEVGGDINVKEGNTLYVDISVYSPFVDAAG